MLEQYLYYHTNKQVSKEISIPGNLSHHHFGEYFDSHEFIVENKLNFNLNNLLLSKKFIYPFNLHPQKSLNYIWQPPEMI
jgi:hypothetical protein